MSIKNSNKRRINKIWEAREKKIKINIIIIDSLKKFIMVNSLAWKIKILDSVNIKIKIEKIFLWRLWSSDKVLQQKINKLVSKVLEK